MVDNLVWAFGTFKSNKHMRILALAMAKVIEAERAIVGAAGPLSHKHYFFSQFPFGRG